MPKNKIRVNLRTFTRSRENLSTFTHSLEYFENKNLGLVYLACCFGDEVEKSENERDTLKSVFVNNKKNSLR